MAQQTLANQESGLTIRNKINSNFTELYEFDTYLRSVTADFGGAKGDFLPLSGGNLTGALTVNSPISSSQTISASGARVITGLPTDTTPVYYVTVLPQSAYDVLSNKNPNTIYFIS
jgi:hypothetical protein